MPGKVRFCAPWHLVSEITVQVGKLRERHRAMAFWVARGHGDRLAEDVGCGWASHSMMPTLMGAAGYRTAVRASHECPLIAGDKGAINGAPAPGLVASWVGFTGD